VPTQYMYCIGFVVVVVDVEVVVVNVVVVEVKEVVVVNVVVVEVKEVVVVNVVVVEVGVVAPPEPVAITFVSTVAILFTSVVP